MSLHAPAEHGGILSVPLLSSVWPLLKHEFKGEFAGRSIHEIRSQARTEVIEAARSYLAERDEPIPKLDHDNLLLAGHQPELFHPGVWLKNFALNALAQEHRLTPLNLVVDNDVIKTNSLRIPLSEPRYYSTRMLGVPYEEALVEDEKLFDRVDEITLPWKNMLSDYWDHIREVTPSTKKIGERFAGARRALERDWDCHNLELPVSRLCETRSFQWFVESLLHDLPRFREVHNEYLTAHRRANHVKRSQYPVPNLMRVGEWVEAPFWLWKSGNRQRRRLFVRQRDKLEVRVEQQTVDFRSLREDGWKIRPRALTLTMFCRLFVADLFIHGIGGALYDELNDTIMYGYTNIKPAPFLVLSGTLRLPLKRSGAEQDCRLLEWMIRDLQQNPQRHLSADESEKVRELLEAKQKWIELRVATAEGRHRRWRELRSITQQLQPMIQDQLQVLRQRLSECREKLRECRSAQRRDTAFCLYPEEMLRDFFAEVTSLCQSAERSQ